MAASHEYICGGALLRCDKGATPGRLFVPLRFVTLGGQPMANATDQDPLTGARRPS